MFCLYKYTACLTDFEKLVVAIQTEQNATEISIDEAKVKIENRLTEIESKKYNLNILLYNNIFTHKRKS